MTFEDKSYIFTQNLKEFNKKQAIASQQAELTVIELAHLYCESNKSLDDTLKLLGDLIDDLSVKDVMTFLCELCRSEHINKIKDMVFIGSTEPTSAGAHSKISYLKNRYNDIAFEQFSHSVSNAKAEYALSFSECCENVLYGRCEFCILPIMNSNDGRLMSFYGLLDRYDLKICDVVDIDNDDSTSTFRHALLGRACKEQRMRPQKNQNYIFEFSIITDKPDFFTSLLLAADKINAKLICIDSLPIEYASDMQKFFISFSIPSQNTLAFRLFLALNLQAHTPLGFYKEKT